ncbi:TraR/DksA C4-type zinc finger protein [Phenylobacterium sp.]|uniref:TraR/DksA C4-type zinc finger protein n=1 Tax=Phenylobacterium sp. TaxID=1871053 RepID=UPI00391AE173
MSDVIDQAQHFEAFRRDLAVRAARAGAHELASPAAFGLCEGCGDPIEAERRRAAPGARKCLLCQEAAERRLRTHR